MRELNGNVLSMTQHSDICCQSPNGQLWVLGGVEDGLINFSSYAGWNV